MGGYGGYGVGLKLQWTNVLVGSKPTPGRLIEQMTHNCVFFKVWGKSPIDKLSINIENYVVSAARTAWNLGGTLDDQLFFTERLMFH